VVIEAVVLEGFIELVKVVWGTLKIVLMVDFYWIIDFKG